MSDQETLELLKSIDARLARLEAQQNEPRSLESMPLPPEFSILTDTIDGAFNPASEDGRENLKKLESVGRLLKILSEKETLEAIETLAGSVKQVAEASVQLKELQNVLSIMTDSVDEMMGKAIAGGLNIENLGENLTKFNQQLIHLVESGALPKLLESGILDDKAIEVVGALGQSLAVSNSHAANAGRRKKIGPLALLGSLFDQDIQRSLGFAISLATHFGRKIKIKK